MRSQFVKRHLFSLSALFFAALVLLGWFRSTRAMSSYNAETPFGIFQFQSETSVFQVGAKFMQHEHRWAFWNNSDPIWGDHMAFVAMKPQIRMDGGFVAVYAAYWQLLLLLLLLAVGFFFTEKRRILRKKAEIDEAVGDD